MQNQYGVRKFLNDQGYKDDDIQWDPDRQMVTLQGKDFYGATPQQDGKTYGSMTDLNNAMGNFNNMKRNQSLNTLTDTMMQKAQAPVQPYTFNPDTDPLMQAAARNATVNANRASNNAMVSYGARGIGNSSATRDRVAQIQQQSLGELTDKVMPQIAGMSYNQYMGQQGLENQKYNQLANLVPLLTGMNQQDFNNRVTEAGLTGAWNGNDTMAMQGQKFNQGMQNKQANWGAYMDMTNLTGNLGTGPKQDWQLLDGQGGPATLPAEQWRMQYDREGDQWNKDYKLRERESSDSARYRNAQIANMNADNARLSSTTQQKLQPSAKAEDYTKDIDNSTFITDEIINDQFGGSQKTGRKVVYDESGLKQYINSLGLPTKEVFKLYKRYNIDTTELNGAMNQGGGAYSDEELLQYLK